MNSTQALAALAERKANPPEKIRNEDLHAGSPMYFYCRECGHLAHTRPEFYNPITDGPTKRYCDECQKLIDEGLLEASSS